MKNVAVATIFVLLYSAHAQRNNRSGGHEHSHDHSGGRHVCTFMELLTCWNHPCDRSHCWHYPEAYCRVKFLPCGCRAAWYTRWGEVDCNVPNQFRLRTGGRTSTRRRSRGRGQLAFPVRPSPQFGECPHNVLRVKCRENPCWKVDIPGATCRPNYCGGCIADLYQNGMKLQCERCSFPQDIIRSSVMDRDNTAHVDMNKARVNGGALPAATGDPHSLPHAGITQTGDSVLSLQGNLATVSGLFTNTRDGPTHSGTHASGTPDHTHTEGHTSGVPDHTHVGGQTIGAPDHTHTGGHTSGLPDHTHTGGHTSGVPDHTHVGGQTIGAPDHTHTGGHTSGLPEHTHTGGHTSGLPDHTHIGGQTIGAPDHTHTGGQTSGAPDHTHTGAHGAGDHGHPEVHVHGHRHGNGHGPHTLPGVTCPQGQHPSECANDPCANRVCTRYPTAECRRSPCGNCQAKWYVNNTEVDCEVCASNVYVAQCPVNPCDIYSCPGHPDAVCRWTKCSSCKDKWFVGEEEVTCDIPWSHRTCTREENKQCTTKCYNYHCPSDYQALCRVRGCGATCEREYYKTVNHKVVTVQCKRWGEPIP